MKGAFSSLLLWGRGDSYLSRQKQQQNKFQILVVDEITTVLRNDELRHIRDELIKKSQSHNSTKRKSLIMICINPFGNDSERKIEGLFFVRKIDERLRDKKNRISNKRNSTFHTIGQTTGSESEPRKSNEFGRRKFWIPTKNKMCGSDAERGTTNHVLFI